MAAIQDLATLDEFIKEKKNQDFVYFSDIPDICKNEPV